MTYARPSTMAIVASENASCFSTLPKIERYLTGDTRSTMADATVASAHALPAAASQLNVKRAPYGAGAATIGATRVIWLCRPGQSNTMFVVSSMLFVTG